MGLHLTLMSPERTVIRNIPVDSVKFSGVEGQIEIRNQHAPMMGQLEPGAFEYRAQDGSSGAGFISFGYFRVEENRVVVLADTFELREEIDSDRATKAVEKAKKMLGESALDDAAFRKHTFKLQRALVRQQISGK